MQNVLLKSNFKVTRLTAKITIKYYLYFGTSYSDSMYACSIPRLHSSAPRFYSFPFLLAYFNQSFLFGCTYFVTLLPLGCLHLPTSPTHNLDLFPIIISILSHG
mgnify:CR=1 FL=1